MITRSRDFILKANALREEDGDYKNAVEHASQHRLANLDKEISYNEILIQDREIGIEEIENMMQEVNEIFYDLTLLVGEQQEFIGTF